MVYSITKQACSFYFNILYSFSILIVPCFYSFLRLLVKHLHLLTCYILPTLLNFQSSLPTLLSIAMVPQRLSIPSPLFHNDSSVSSPLPTIHPVSSLEPSPSSLGFSSSIDGSPRAPIMTTSTPQTTTIVPNVAVNTHPMITHSKFGISKKKILLSTKHPTNILSNNNYNTTEPTCSIEATKSPDWRKAMSEKFSALQRQGTWTLDPFTPKFFWHLIYSNDVRRILSQHLKSPASLAANSGSSAIA